MTGTGGSGDELATFARLEARLADLSGQIAQLLVERDPSAFAPHVDRVWTQMKALEHPYRQALAALSQPAVAARVSARNPLAGGQVRQAARYGGERVRLWPRVEALLSRVLAPHHAPLVTEASRQVRGREDGAVNNLMRILAAAANPEADRQSEAMAGSYADISLSGAYFLDLCSAAYRVALAQGRPRPVRFLDIGSGGGSKLVAASSYFEDVTGLEYNPDYVRRSRHWLDSVGAEDLALIEGDALAFEGYGDFDVIYFYRPLREPSLQAEMEERVVRQARPGTIVIAVLTVALHGMDAPVCARLSNAIFVTGTDAESLSDFRQRAERIGPDVGLHDPTLQERAGFWVPILDAARRRGFELR